MTKDESREIVYGEPFEQVAQAKHQKEASPAQKAAFEKSSTSTKYFAQRRCALCG